MKIHKVIMSSDDNPVYLDFWEIVSGIWKEIFEIQPVLLYFGNKNPSTKYGEVILFPKDNYSVPLKTLWSRYWFPQNEPETIFMISDIDMIPLSKYYFIDQLMEIDDDKYVHLVGNHRPLPSCYHIAKGKNFSKVLNLPQKFEDTLDMIIKTNIGGAYNIPFSENIENQWGSDEIYATNKIEFEMSRQTDKFIMIDRNLNKNRLDRMNWEYSEVDILNHKFYDCHSIRPYLKFKNEIDNLISFLRKSY